MAVGARPEQTLGAFKFLKPSEVYQREKLYTLNYNPGDSGIARSNIDLDERSRIPVTNLRDLHQPLLWEGSGIGLRTILPVLSEEDFRDNTKIVDRYYPEIKRVLGKMLKPSKIVVLEHTVLLHPSSSLLH